jgi:hypothetical protein
LLRVWSSLALQDWFNLRDWVNREAQKINGDCLLQIGTAGCGDAAAKRNLIMTQQKTTQLQHEKTTDTRERGQSIVIVALSLIGLLAFVGIAVDVGFIFARSSQLQSAVDSAALAGVTEVQRGINAANQRAGQFLNANNIPISVTLSLQSRQDTTIIGETEYTLTVTWPVELFFLRVIGIDNYTLSRSATAAYFPQADLYASRRVDQGVIGSTNQSIFGPNSCTLFGDPYSPFNSTWKPGAYTYNYRILIPSNYPSDVLRIEIFDPDSINKTGTGDNILFSDFARAANPTLFPAGPQARTCPGNSAERQNACLLLTGEKALVNPTTGVTIDHINQFWLVRVDENRGPDCNPNPSSYNQTHNTGTLYEIFYYRQNEDGTLDRIALSSYTGQTGQETNSHDTDLRWVSPGGPLKSDQTTPVPVNPGSERTFHLSINNDLPNILTDPMTGNRYIYLDVTAMSGSSENGYEVWAGPWYPEVPSNGNSRNLYVANNPGSSSSMGATVFAMGVLPMNSNATEIVDIPLLYVGTEMIGQSIFISTFDLDSNAKPPIIFYFDSLAFTSNDSATDGVNWSATDWAMSFGGGTDPAGRCFSGGASYNNGCNNMWVSPPYELVVPGNLESCNYGSPTMADCTPFYGGRLMARYRAGAQDTFVWQINVTGLPYLVR